ncbi:uncharacterized protein LOC111369718 isoform X3 [Olea europaea var. sylvestris]|uniref:uncharacterized protein LOC111369718 isoform X3 n=1 Tax=Olea europaea var. sylvestris TaxID=158386 RepID=UPI000C1D7948|nr:uncharacterized protein LOC111369718 isoform X3 [Olea europaea var. sylvestris]
MLQWMGGSRRKVIASRRSTQKRQKQYFEQRKRQQQQLSAGLENDANGRHSCSQHHGNERSLDILSFLNLSTLTQDQKSTTCLIGKDSPENDTFNLNYQNAHYSPAIHTKKAIAGDHFETNEARPSLCGHVETSPKKLPVSPLDYKEGLTGNGDKLKLTTQCHGISVIDLLGDDGAHGTVKEISVHAPESHVAFSVEGLGKVETETPINSPCRSVLNSFSSLEEARRQARTSKTFKYGLDDFESRMDDMVEDIDFSSLYNDSIDQPFSCSGDYTFGNSKPRLSKFRKSLPFDRYDNSLNDVLGDDVIMYDTKDSDENIWNAGSIFLDNHIDKVEEYRLFCKNQVDLRDDDYADYSNNNDHWGRDFNFEGSSLQERRASKHRTENIDIRDPHSPSTKHQMSEYLRDFEISDARWFTIGIDHNVKDASNQPSWSCFIREHERENLSLSEESCSSSAVRGNESNRPPTRKEGTQVHGIHGWFQENKCYEKNIDGKKINRGNRSHLQQRESVNRLGKLTRMPEASLTPACFQTATFESNSFCQTSGMRKLSASGPSAWSKDVFDVTDSQLIIDCNTPFKRSPDLPGEHSPISEEMYFRHPCSHVYSHETPSPISQNIEFVSTVPNLSKDSKGNTVLDSLCSQSYLGLEKESLSRDGEKSVDNPSIVEDNIELQMDVSDGSKGLSSKMGSPSISPNRTPEMKESMKETDSTDLAKDTSSFVEIPCTSGGIQLCQGDTRILLPWKTESRVRRRLWA